MGSPAVNQHSGRVLIIAPHSSYRTAAYIEAAQQCQIDVLIASEGEHSIVSDFASGLHIRFAEPDAAFQSIINAARQQPFRAVIGTDDSCLELAARVARELQLAHNPPEAVRLAGRKDLARERLRQAGVMAPAFKKISLHQDLPAQVASLDYPLVIKPLALSGSRGVIRVDNDEQLQQACARVARMLAEETQLEASLRQQLLVEQYIPGEEVALEGMLSNGQLQVLTVFDKPDPLQGPFFEETYYISPSRHAPQVLEQLQQTVQQACQAYGLVQGPVHAECRINQQGVWILEVAARTIGGLCARLLTYGTGHSLEQLVLAQAMGQPLNLPEQRQPCGVLMIPITQGGIFKRVEGLLDAQRVSGITDIDIQIREGYRLVPLPEGASYLGFMFAEAASAQQVEAALREAHRHLNIVVTPEFSIQVA